VLSSPGESGDVEYILASSVTELDFKVQLNALESLVGGIGEQ